MHVLIVEENADMAWMLAAMLRGFGHSSRVASSAFDALAEAASTRTPFQMAIVDLGLHDAKGARLAPLLKEKGITGIAFGDGDANGAGTGFAFRLRTITYEQIAAIFGPKQDA